MPDRTRSSENSSISLSCCQAGLKNVSAAISMGNFEHVANAPAEEIARARDDAKNSRGDSPLLYEANRWIYGDGAFGLRLAAWIARKAPDVLVETTTLLMFRLREVPEAILPSDEIAELARQARTSAWLQRSMNGSGATIPVLGYPRPKANKVRFRGEIARNAGSAN